MTPISRRTLRQFSEDIRPKKKLTIALNRKPPSSKEHFVLVAYLFSSGRCSCIPFTEASLQLAHMLVESAAIGREFTHFVASDRLGKGERVAKF